MSREKVVIKPIFIRNPFLKTPDEVIELFGLSTSIRSQFKLISRLMKLDVTVSDRSLDNLSRKGISERKATEIFEPILTVIEDRLKGKIDTIIPDGARTSDIHLLWPAAIKLFMCGAQFTQQEQNCLQPLKRFLERRCREYLPQSEWYSKFGEMDNKARLRHLPDFYLPVIDKMLLDSTEKNIVMKILSTKALGEKIEVEKNEALALGLFSQDFNLSLFASLDLVAKNFAFLFFNDEKKVHESFLKQILAVEGQCYFGKLLSLIKSKTGCTYKKLAQLIPVQFQSTDSGRTELEIKIERLKEWRKGKTKPSFKVLDEFFSHFSNEDQMPLFIYGHICLAIDRLIGKYKSVGDRKLLQNVYSPENYIRYYTKEKEAAKAS